MNVLMDHIHVIAMPYVLTLMGVSTVPVTMAMREMDSTAVSLKTHIGRSMNTHILIIL